jgi:hypothetical protein
MMSNFDEMIREAYGERNKPVNSMLNLKIEYPDFDLILVNVVKP